MNRGQLLLVNLLLLALLFGASLAVFGQLPDRIAVHFGAGGLPDRWADRSWLSWLQIPFIALVMTLMMIGVNSLIGHMPQGLNVPNPKLYRALSMESKMQVVELSRTLILAITTLMNLMFCALQAGAYETAIGTSPGLPWYAGLSILLMVVGTMGLAIWSISASTRLVKRLAAEEDQQSAVP